MFLKDADYHEHLKKWMAIQVPEFQLRLVELNLTNTSEIFGAWSSLQIAIWIAA